MLWNKNVRVLCYMWWFYSKVIINRYYLYDKKQRNERKNNLKMFVQNKKNLEIIYISYLRNVSWQWKTWIFTYDFEAENWRIPQNRQETDILKVGLAWGQLRNNYTVLLSNVEYSRQRPRVWAGHVAEESHLQRTDSARIQMLDYTRVPLGRRGSNTARHEGWIEVYTKILTIL